MSTDILPLEDQKFLISAENSHALSKTVIHLVRFDESFSSGSLADAIQGNLIRLDAAFSRQINNDNVSLEQLAALEAMLDISSFINYNFESLKDFAIKTIPGSDNSLAKAFCYMNAIKYIYNGVTETTIINKELLQNIYDKVSGTSKGRKYSPHLFVKPTLLLEDYCNYIAKPVMDPVSMSFLSCSQLAKIMGSDCYFEEFQRAMSYTIFKKRGVLKNIPLPLAAGPAKESILHNNLNTIFIDNPEITYNNLNKNEITRFYIFYCDLSVQLTNVVKKSLMKVLDDWKSLFPESELSKSLLALMRCFIAQPITTASGAASYTGMSLSSICGSLKILEQKGIIEYYDCYNKHRLYKASNVIEAMNSIFHRIIENSRHRSKTCPVMRCG